MGVSSCTNVFCSPMSIWPRSGARAADEQRTPRELEHVHSRIELQLYFVAGRVHPAEEGRRDSHLSCLAASCFVVHVPRLLFFPTEPRPSPTDLSDPSNRHVLY